MTLLARHHLDLHRREREREREREEGRGGEESGGLVFGM
jgi:hypothetical protein